MEDANNYAFWYHSNDKTQDSNSDGNGVVNDLHADFDSFDSLQNFTSNIPDFSDDIVSAFEVNQVMETMSEESNLFSELDIFNSVTPRKSAVQDNSNVITVTPVANHMNGDAKVTTPGPKSVAETVGRQSIKQLLQSPPQYNGSDGENMMKKTTSFVCNKSEELDDKDMPFPVVQDIKPSETATITIPCTSVIKNAPIQIIQSTSPQSTSSTTLQANYSQSTPTLQALLMTPKPVSQQNGQQQQQQQQNGQQQQQFIITTKGNQQIIQTIQTPIQVTAATNVQFSQGGAISVIQPNTAVFQQKNSPQQQKQIFTTSPQHQSTIGTGITTIQTNNPNLQRDSSPRSNFGSSPPSNQTPLALYAAKLPIERVSPPAPGNNNKQPKVNKTQRSAHNAIEKRYRASINKRISELHELLCPGGSDSKLSKAAILEKAIRQIKYLTQLSTKLRTENIWLRKITSTVENVPGKMIAEQPPSMIGSPEVDDVTMMHEAREMMICDGIPSPPNSDSAPDSPNSLNNDSDFLTPINGGSPNMQQQTVNINTRCGMQENSRFVLCLFSLFCISFDPFNKLLGVLFGRTGAGADGEGANAAADSGHIGRIILGYGSLTSSSGWLDWMFPTLLTWCMNGTICIFALLKLLVWGEPVTEENSKSHHKYLELRQNANDEMRKGKYESAAELYHSCLETLGRPMPVGKLDKVSCVSWNIIRFFLGLVKISPFMARKLSRDPKNVQLSARLAAQIYHRLDQLNMTGKMEYSCLDGFIYSLNSMNLCEVAGWELTPPDVAVRIYATAALRAKKVLPKFLLKWFSWYFINRSQRVLSTYSTECDDELKWLNEPDGQQFLINDDNWTYDSETESDHVDFSTISDKEDPISHAAFHFRKHLLQKALYSLVMPVVFSDAERRKTTANNSNKKKRRQPPAAAALQFLQLVAQCEEDEFDEDEDEAESKFWLSVATVAAHYAMGDDKSAAEHSQIIQQLPLSLELSKNELPRTVSWAFVAYRDMLSLAANNHEDDDVTMNNNNEDAARHCDVLQTCNKSSRSLRDNLLNRSNNKQIPMAFRLIACEWLLKARTLLWEHTQCHDGVTRRATYEQLTAFECDVTLLRAIVHEQPSLYPKVCIYEATARMMAGASPVQTEMLLNSVIRRRRPTISRKDRGNMELEVGEYERAYANILACKHLASPMLSAPGERNSMLKDASHVMELLGDERSVKTATDMLKKLGCNDAANEE